MESTRGKDSKYPLVTKKKTKEIQAEGLLSGLISMGKAAMSALIEALRGYNNKLGDAVKQLQVVAKNARMGIVSEVVSTSIGSSNIQEHSSE
jgi:hypothetical protein